jgi:hypothetical protein
VRADVRCASSTHTCGLVPWRALVRVEQAFLPTVAPWLGGSPFNALVSAVRPSSQRTFMGNRMSAAAAESAARMERFLAGPENTGLDEAVQPVLIGRFGHCPRGRPRARDLPTCTWSSTSATRSASAPKGPASGASWCSRSRAGDCWAAWLAAVAHAGVVLEQAGDAALEAVQLGEARLSGTHRGCPPLEKTSSRSPIAYTFQSTSPRTSLDAAGHPRDMSSGPHRAARPNHRGAAGTGGATAGRGRGVGFYRWAAAGWRRPACLPIGVRLGAGCGLSRSVQHGSPESHSP